MCIRDSTNTARDAKPIFTTATRNIHAKFCEGAERASLMSQINRTRDNKIEFNFAREDHTGDFFRKSLSQASNNPQIKEVSATLYGRDFKTLNEEISQNTHIE